MTQTDQNASAGRSTTAETLSYVALTAVLALILVALFWSAGTIDWRRGWLFFTLYLVLIFVALGWIKRDNPELIAFRSKMQKGTRSWDAVVASLTILLYAVIIPVAGLDDGRFHWAPTPDWVTLVGYALLTGGMMGVTWAQSVNPFFEATVRIQTDRGHRVIDTGPYVHIRHPGYAFAVLMAAGTALSLGSLFALIPVALLTALLAVRTLAEEAVLKDGLAGYPEYMGRVRHRWIPGVW